MASEKTIQDMLTFFTDLGYRMPGPASEIINSWMHVFDRYTDAQLKPAVYSCADEVFRFPVPAEIIARIKAIAPPLETYESHETKTNCSKCGKWRYCRKDSTHPQYECEDCYTGLTKEERIQRVKDFTKTLKGGLFKSMDEAA